MDFWSLLGIKKNEGKRVRFRDTLRSIPIFSELGRRELASVERILHKREYAAGEVIFRQDEPGLGMYIIESGRVSILTDQSHDNMTELGDGEFFGELPLLDGGSRSATAVAKTACRIFGFFQPDLFSLIERNPRLGVKIVLSLAAIIGMRLRAVNERVQTLLAQGAPLGRHGQASPAEEDRRRIEAPMNPARSLVLNRWLAISGLALLILLFLLVPGVVKMIVAAFLLAYIFDPIVTAIEVRGLSRTASTVVFFLFVIAIAWILFSILAPVVYNQIQTMRSGAGSRQTSEVILRLQAVVRAKLGFVGLGEVNLQEKIEQFSSYMSDTIVDFILHEGLSIVLYAVTVPFLVFFLLKDGREMKKMFIGIVPNRYFEFALDLLYKMDLQLGNYLRSQFTDAVVFGVLATIALWLLGVKYFLFIGVFAGLANLIPYVGPIAGALPAVAVALFDAGDVTLALQIVLAFIILKLTDDMLVQPLLVAKGVHLHPLLVLLAIIIGGELFGMLGMLLAVPATGFVKVVLQESIVTLKKYRFTD